MKSRSGVDSLLDLIKNLFNDDNWYLGGFVVALILFIIWDLIVVK
ncbi:hypothetical protein HS7_04920 [Sulfolobales archaeon HS-7]|nr:hypothetical protein HS7_04920 [Sulfolobales archaeon HS-7]